MRLATEKIRQLARHQGLSLSELLEKASVSRNAYYSLARRDSVLPRTLDSLARTLQVPQSELLEDVPDRVAAARQICAQNPEATFENVWHVLTLLEMNPTERLNRSLIRGRATPVQR